MKKVLLLLPAVSVMELTSGVIHAQPQTEISIGGDLVSTYVWRGVYQSGFSLQPEIGLSVGGFTVGVWGSTDLDNFKEVDLSVGYSVRGFSVGVTDYWWGGQRLGDGRFAPYFKYGDTHYFEGTLAYEFGEKFPLGISWSTMFAGADKKENGDRAWSSYVELAYPFSVGSVELTAAAGAAHGRLRPGCRVDTTDSRYRMCRSRLLGRSPYRKNTKFPFSSSLRSTRSSTT